MAASRWRGTVATVAVRDTQARRDQTAEGKLSNQAPLNRNVPRRLFGKTTPQGHAVAVTTQEALDGSREKTMTIANVENNA